MFHALKWTTSAFDSGFRSKKSNNNHSHDFNVWALWQSVVLPHRRCGRQACSPLWPIWSLNYFTFLLLEMFLWLQCFCSFFLLSLYHHQRHFSEATFGAIRSLVCMGPVVQVYSPTCSEKVLPSVNTFVSTMQSFAWGKLQELPHALLPNLASKMMVPYKPL